MLQITDVESHFSSSDNLLEAFLARKPPQVRESNPLYVYLLEYDVYIAFFF